MMLLYGLCRDCVHNVSCHLLLTAVGLDHNNTFNAVADVTHCKQYKRESKA